MSGGPAFGVAQACAGTCESCPLRGNGASALASSSFGAATPPALALAALCGEQIVVGNVPVGKGKHDRGKATRAIVR